MACINEKTRLTFIICAAFLMLLHVANADIIGVDISEQGQEDATLGAKPRTEQEDIVGLYDSVMRLNRITFNMTILEEHADEVAHWIVLFCPPWYEPCQAIEPIFRQQSEKWQSRLNNALLSTEVRFAAVDCATEKALCNEQNVVQYPFVAHYHRRQQVKLWRGKSFETDKKRLGDFLQKELGPVAAATSMSQDGEDATAEGIQKIPVDFLLIFAAIAGNAWFISRGGFGSEAASQTPAKQTVIEGPPSSAAGQAQSAASCVARSFPKEWGSDRQSLEL